MSGAGAVPASTGATRRPGPVELARLLYALSGGVAWWAFHLCALSALAPGVCGGLPHWLLSAVNVVSVLGVVSALLPSLALMRAAGAAAAADRNRFLGYVAVLFNLASLALVVLESVPVYVLDACR